MSLLETTYGPGVSSGSAEADATRTTYIANLLALSTITTNYSVIWEDFDRAITPPGFALTVASGGTALPVNVDGGVSRLASGGSAGGDAYQYTAMPLVTGAATDKWGLACRFRIPSALDANSKVFLGLGDVGASPTNMVSFGHYGNLSTTHIVIQHGAYGAGSSVNLLATDTDWHIVEMYHSGDGKVRARIDGANDIAATTIAAEPANARVWAESLSVNAVDRYMDRDWLLVVYPR